MLKEFIAEQKFHETITPSLARDVEHVTIWSDLPAFTLSPNVSKTFSDDPALIHDLCSDILERLGSSELYVIGLNIQSEQTAEGSRIKAFLLRTADHNYVFKVRPVFSRFHGIHVSE